MQKSTVRRGAMAGGFAGVALVAALIVPAAANAAAPEATSGAAQAVDAPRVVQPGNSIEVGPDRYAPGDPSQTVIVTQDRDGNVSVLPGQPGQLPPGAVLATPMPGDQPRVTLVPRDGIPALPTAPALTAPSSGSAG
ncbi:hypothetical protein [Nocardia sp. NBC_01327]|uniref:hypothetical protein n=1 Tax=Nocardia sp. NBC_01327 TaxID=2903593 RepID=UPI002E0F3843|nr:hypothetical protein OG326_07805 [Nocardia sp. NBC_01327]